MQTSKTRRQYHLPDDLSSNREAVSTPATDRINGNLRPQSPPLAVRIAEACRLTGLGRSKLYALIQDGTLEVVKVGSATLVPMENLERLVGGRQLGVGLVADDPNEFRIHAFLMQAIFTACLANLPLTLRRELASANGKVRVRAEDVVADRLLAALRKTG